MNVKIAAAMLPKRCGVGSPSASRGRKNDIPHHSRQRPISGNVVRSRLRRPKVSIVYMAGMAKSQLVTPVPKDTSRAWLRENPASSKMVEPEIGQ